MANFKFKSFSRPCLAFRENSFIFAIQTSPKKQIRFLNNHNPQNTRFSHQGSFQTILWKTYYDQIRIRELFLAFPEDIFNFVTQERTKNWNMPFPNTQKYAFDLKVASKTFSIMNVSHDKSYIQTILKDLTHFSRKYV